jgi:type I restriction enzyme S subunit
MSSDIQTRPLGKLGVLDRGRSRHRPRYAPHLYGGRYPFIQTGDIKASGGKITTFSQTYSEAGLEQSRLWDAGTLCITIAANIAETGMLTFPACFPDSVVGFIADPALVDVRYVEYTFRHLRSRIQSDATGSVQDNINLEYLRKHEIPVFPLEEQKAIAHILGTLDDKIELNRKTNATLEAMAKALFKSWFVDFDPVRAKAEGRPTGLPAEISDLFPDSFEDSELGEIPSGWEVKALDDVAHFLNGLALQKFPPQEGDSTLPVIKIAQLKKGDTLGADRCSTAVPDEYVIRDGDVLFSWSGSLAVDIWCGGEGALNQHLFKVTSKAYQKWFVYHWVKRHLPEFQEIAQGKATTMGHIQRRHLSEAKALVPATSLLTAMDLTFTPLLDRAYGLRRQSRELSLIRDALLPKLISGEIRIPDAERMLEEVGI